MIGMWAVPVAGIDAGRVQPDHLHAVVARWLDSRHRQTVKPWAVMSMGTTDGIPTVGVVTFGESAGERMLSATHAGHEMRLGAQQGCVLSSPILQGAVRPEQLLADAAQDASAATVWSFVTPATFRRQGRSTPLPDPQRVTHSVSARWAQLYPEHADALRFEPAEVAEILVTDIDGRNEVCRVGRIAVSGFVGRVRYEVGRGADPVRFAALSRFAAIAGVGAYTTRGLGRVRLERTWQPER